MDEEPRLPIGCRVPPGAPDGAVGSGGDQVEVVVAVPERGHRRPGLQLDFGADEEPRLPIGCRVPPGAPDGAVGSGGEQVEVVVAVPERGHRRPGLSAELTANDREPPLPDIVRNLKRATLCVIGPEQAIYWP